MTQKIWQEIKYNPPQYNTSLLFSFADGTVAEGEYKKHGLVVQYRWNCTRNDAVAWQPLPQSYKGE